MTNNKWSMTSTIPLASTRTHLRELAFSGGRAPSYWAASSSTALAGGGGAGLTGGVSVGTRVVKMMKMVKQLSSDANKSVVGTLLRRKGGAGVFDEVGGAGSIRSASSSWARNTRGGVKGRGCVGSAVTQRHYSRGYYQNNWTPPSNNINKFSTPPPALPNLNGEQMLWSIIGANTFIFACWHVFDPRMMVRTHVL